MEAGEDEEGGEGGKGKAEGHRAENDMKCGSNVRPLLARALAKRRFKTKRVFTTKRVLKRNGDLCFVVRFVLARFKTKQKQNDSASLDTFFKTPNTSWVSPLALE